MDDPSRAAKARAEQMIRCIPFNMRDLSFDGFTSRKTPFGTITGKRNRPSDLRDLIMSPVRSEGVAEFP
jgi:hypothetical protein